MLGVFLLLGVVSIDAETNDNLELKESADAKNGLVLRSFLCSLDEELTALYQLPGCLHEKLEVSLLPRCKWSIDSCIC